MPRFRNEDWVVRAAENNPTSAANCHEASLAVLMDIREEMQQMNSILGCQNVAKGFRALQHIARQNDAIFKRRVESAIRKRAQRRKSK